MKRWHIDGGSAASSPSMKRFPRSGLSLVELLLAVVLFAVGVLGLASSATFIAAQADDARRLTEAARFAATRLDSLRASPCLSLVSGSSASRAGTMSWSVAASPQSQSVQATLTFQRHRHPTTRVFDVLIPCER